MANKKKNYWYVLVCTNEGPVLVTKVHNENKTAEWNRTEKPIDFSENWAKDLTFGLRCNFNSAFTVCSPVELDSQPYRYADGGHFEWKWDEGAEK